MSPAPFRIETLGGQHDRAAFSCGVTALDRYLHQQAGQDVRRRVAACYVSVDAATGAVAGYFTLAASGVALSEMPATLIKILPRYPLVPVARLGRLAVDQRYRGQGLGAALVWDAATRAARSEVAVFALLVDAKDRDAEMFYLHHGFLPFGDHRQLLLALTNFK